MVIKKTVNPGDEGRRFRRTIDDNIDDIPIDPGADTGQQERPADKEKLVNLIDVVLVVVLELMRMGDPKK